MARFDVVSAEARSGTLVSGAHVVVRNAEPPKRCLLCGGFTHWRLYRCAGVYVCSEECLSQWANDDCSPAPATDDPINSPSHYTAGGVEPIDAIEAWGLGFCLGNAVKYIARAGKKDPSKLAEDLKKARWYLDRRIKQLEASK